MKVRAIKLQDVDYGDQWDREIEDQWSYRDFIADDRWREGWISFDCGIYRPDERRVYLGVTCFDAKRIFVAYDRDSDGFVELGYDRVADPFDAKFHRSMVTGSDGCLYAAPALLHCPDQYLAAPGAAIVRYNPADGTIEKLGTPLPHAYIQALTIDRARETLYCLTFAPEYLVSYHIPTGESRVLGLIGSGIFGMTQSENLVLDDDDCVWSNWSLSRAWQTEAGPDVMRISKYDPRQERMIYFDEGLPWPDGRPGYAKVEAYFNLGDGNMYASGANGAFYRLDRDTGKAEHLFTPTPDRPSRLTSLVVDDERGAWGVTGRDGNCELMRIDVDNMTFEKPVEMKNGAAAMWQCHDIVRADDGVMFACENDNTSRSSYLWEVTP